MENVKTWFALVTVLAVGGSLAYVGGQVLTGLILAVML